MGYRLYRELVEHGPRDLPHSALWLWGVLADDANDTTRVSMVDRDTLSRRARLRRTSLLHWLRVLADSGYELRVIRGKNKHGQPVYAYQGARANYLLPVLSEGVAIADTLSSLEGVTVSAPSDDTRVSPHAPEGVGIRHTRVSPHAPEGVTVSTPHPLSPLKVPSSPLSTVGVTVSTPTDDERLIDHIRRTKTWVTNPAGYAASLPADDRTRLIAEATAATADADRESSRAAYRTNIDAAVDCPHGIRGGFVLHPDSGEPGPCVECRIAWRRKRAA
jgi:hypothetical protein